MVFGKGLLELGKNNKDVVVLFGRSDRNQPELTGLKMSIQKDLFPCGVAEEI